MTVDIVFYCFCLVALVGQEQQCDAAVTCDATSAMEILVEDWFPQDIEFNESCVAEGCPDLKNLSFCPSDLDINALRNITKTISDCMSGPICGIVIEPRPFKSMVFSTDPLLPGIAVKGIITTSPGGGYLSNISNIHLDTTSNRSQHLPLQMSVLMPNIRLRGQYQMYFHLETGFGPDLTANLSQLTYDIEIQFFSIFSINCTGPNLDIEFLNPFVTVSPLLCGIDLPVGFPNIDPLFTATVRTLYENSSMAIAIGRFMGKLYRGAIQVTSTNCKSSNVKV